MMNLLTLDFDCDFKLNFPFSYNHNGPNLQKRELDWFSLEPLLIGFEMDGFDILVENIRKFMMRPSPN